VIGHSGVLQPPLLIAQSLMVPPPLPFGVGPPSFQMGLMNSGPGECLYTQENELNDINDGGIGEYLMFSGGIWS